MYIHMSVSCTFVLVTIYVVFHSAWCRSTLGLRTAMQQQYQLTFTMPIAPPPKKQHQNELSLPDDLAGLQTVSTVY